MDAFRQSRVARDVLVVDLGRLKGAPVERARARGCLALLYSSFQTISQPLMRRALADASITKSALQVSFTWRLGCSLSIDLPPLRKRRMDIPLSFDGCLREHCRRSGREIQGPTHEALAALVQYDGPGNIRELKTSSTEC